MKREPFGGGRERLVSVSGNSRPVRVRLGLNGGPIGTLVSSGNVIYPRWNAQLGDRVKDGVLSLEQVFATREYRVVGDIYTALRMVDHMLGTYNEQGTLNHKEELYRLLDASWQLYDLLLGLRKSTLGALEGDIRKLAAKILASAGKRPNDPLKKAIRSLAGELMAVLDSRDQVNPTAKESQVVTIRGNLYHRLMTIQAIEPNLARWRQSLDLLIDEAERLFAEVRKYLEPAIERLEDGTSLVNPDLDRLVIRLRHYADELERLDINPFRRPCRRMANELRKGAVYVTLGRNQAARTVLRRTNESLKLRGIRADLERFIGYLTLLMSRPNVLISAKDAGRIKRGFANLKRRLAEVNEFRFIHPVCQDSLRTLGLAINITIELVGKRTGSLEEIKGLLKEAAKPL